MSRMIGANAWDERRDRIATHCISGLLAAGVEVKKAAKLAVQAADALIVEMKANSSDPLKTWSKKR